MEMRGDTPSSATDVSGTATASDQPADSVTPPGPSPVDHDASEASEPQEDYAGAPPNRPSGYEPPTRFEDDHGGGSMVTVSGRLIADEGVLGQVDIDCYAAAPDGTLGRVLVNKLKVPEAADYTMRVPVDFGELFIEAFIDMDGDGPDPDEPRGSYSGNPLVVGDRDVDAVDIILTARPDSAVRRGPEADGRSQGGTWRGGGRREAGSDGD